MSILATILRVFIVIAFAIGVVAPAAALDAPAEHAIALSGHVDCVVGPTMPRDDLCREHCRGVSVLPTIIAPAPYNARAVALPVTLLVEIASSLWPLPEQHPPRL